MWRIILIAFLLIHAAIHVAIWATPATKDGGAPFDASKSWLFGSERWLAMVVALAAAVLLAFAGVALWIHLDLWRAVAIAGLGVSVGLMIVWFNPWFTMIEIVNAGLLVGIALYSWPSSELLGA